MIYDIEPYFKLHISEEDVSLYSYSQMSPEGKLLKGYVSPIGYKHYYIKTKSGKVRTQYLHRLVAECVHGPCPEGMEVNHKDGDKLNNHPSNLEYVTRSENMRHAYANGLSVPMYHKGRKAPAYKHGKSYTQEYRRMKVRESYWKKKNAGLDK